MKLRAYSVYDRKALIYMQPFYALTDGAALRIVADAANDAQSALGRHPADYVLFCVGEYDDQKGLLSALAPLEHVIDVQALVQQQPSLFGEEAK